MAVTNLEWKAVPSDNWITVNPTAGTGNETINITVDTSEFVDENNSAGTVTITCLSCSPQQQRIINVTRCPKTDCQYEEPEEPFWVEQTVEMDACKTRIPLTPIRRTIRRAKDPVHCEDIVTDETFFYAFATPNGTNCPGDEERTYGPYSGITVIHKKYDPSKEDCCEGGGGGGGNDPQSCVCEALQAAWTVSEIEAAGTGENYLPIGQLSISPGYENCFSPEQLGAITAVCGTLQDVKVDENLSISVKAAANNDCKTIEHTVLVKYHIGTDDTVCDDILKKTLIQHGAQEPSIIVTTPAPDPCDADNDGYLTQIVQFEKQE